MTTTAAAAAAPAQVRIVLGLQYGDEGKGATVDWACRTMQPAVRLVVRFNGGPQAAHHVVQPNGKFHCFAQLGSGHFVPGVRTLLSRFMLVNPVALRVELEVLEELHGPTGGIERVVRKKKEKIIKRVKERKKERTLKERKKEKRRKKRIKP